MTEITCDNRSQKVVVCCHCVINQNSKLEGIAGWPGVIEQVMDVIIHSKSGILQLGCPEMIYEGIGRFDKSIEQYDCPAFRTICRNVVQTASEQIVNYQKWGYQVKAILAIDGSPSCGYNLAQSAPEWRGLVAGRTWEKVRYEKQQGILFQEFLPFFSSFLAPVPVVGIPEIPELGNLDKTLETLEKLLK